MPDTDKQGALGEARRTQPIAAGDLAQITVSQEAGEAAVQLLRILGKPISADHVAAGLGDSSTLTAFARFEQQTEARVRARVLEEAAPALQWVELLAGWESLNGTLAAITREEYGSLFDDMKRLAIKNSPRRALAVIRARKEAGK